MTRPFAGIPKFAPKRAPPLGDQLFRGRETGRSNYEVMISAR